MFVCCLIYFTMSLYDIRIKTPFSMILAGASGSGKTTWLEKFLKHTDVLTDDDDGSRYRQLFWFSGTKQPELFKRIRSTFGGRVEFFGEITKDIYEQIEENGRNSIIVIDDLMHEMSTNSGIGKLFTKGRSHLNCSVILLWQNVFPQGSEMRNLSINAQHIIIFKNPRDKSQIRFFAQQVAPGKVRNFLEAFNDSTKKQYGYLHCDFSQKTSEDIRFRTNILPGEAPTIAYKL